MTRITLNGLPEEMAADTADVAALVVGRGVDPERVVVERNGAIVRRAEWEQTAIAEGDKIEIVAFVGGG